MSETLLKQWRDRVADAESNLQAVENDLKLILEQRKALKLSSRAHLEKVEKEKKELLQRLESVEAEAKELSTVCEETLREKDKVEVDYLRTLDEYENMHYLVRKIKDKEEELNSREDLEARLQRESLHWAEEEHAMRNKLNNLQLQLKQQRKQQQAEECELEEQLANLQKRYERERAEHRNEQAASAVTDKKISVNNGTETYGDNITIRHDTHITDSTSTATPTAIPTSAAPVPPLKSCLKGKGVVIPTQTQEIASSQLNSYFSKRSPMVASAPISRAASQSLVHQRHNIATNFSSVASKHQQETCVDEVRALPYSSGKACSHSRSMLQEKTNSIE